MGAPAGQMQHCEYASLASMILLTVSPFLLSEGVFGLVVARGVMKMMQSGR
jgi:hypothetical protein